jgi:glycerol-3-phosphate acyltransferase PlsX
MGSFYAKKLMGVENPRVAMLNIGAEESKGDSLRLETYGLLKEAGEAGRINFIGNIEANDAMMGGADVIVADGFSGNVLLKTMEGSAKFLMKELKKMFMSGAKTKVAALLMKESIGEFKKLMDPNEVGGTPFLGISKPVIKAHGSSNAYAFQNAIRQAKDFASSGIIESITANVEVMKLKQTAAEEE